MTPAEMIQHLRHAATRYDRAQSKRRGYNPHALALYFGRLEDEVLPALEAGKDVQAAIREAFNDRLADVLCAAAAAVD